MTTNKMHQDEISIDIRLAKSLISDQFPNWSSLEIKPVHPLGTSNVLYHLGDKMVIRLPRHIESVETLLKEMKWLSTLTLSLNCKIPSVLAEGKPNINYPLPWAIYDWLDGDIPLEDKDINFSSMAKDLAYFLLELQKIDSSEGPTPGKHNFFRGVPLINRNEGTLKALNSLSKKKEIDGEKAIRIWEKAIEAPKWENSPVWIHGDLDRRNILVDKKGNLCGVIDFGGLGVGDPACDIMVAFKMFDASSRKIFKEKLNVDEATWARAKGWGISQAVMALDYYTMENNPTLVLDARKWLIEIFKDDSL